MNPGSARSRIRNGAVALALAAIFSPPISASTEELTLKTLDGARISGTLSLPQTEGRVPAVILIHQGGSDRREWKHWPALLTGAGYAVLAFDLRGHGASEPIVDPFPRIYSDPNLTPSDLAAVIAFLKHHGRIDANRIGIMGASIGANLAVVGVSKLGIRTAVAISGKVDAARSLAGGTELKMKSVFAIAAEKDQEGLRATWARQFYEMTVPPRAIRIVYSSQAHGVSVLEDDPSLKRAIVEWFIKTL